MEILVLGVILFVLGVGATYAYDNWDKVAPLLNLQNRRPSRPAPVVSKKKSVENYEELLKSVNHLRDKQTLVPNRVAARFFKDGDMPDLGTSREMTIQELIAQIERMKNKS